MSAPDLSRRRNYPDARFNGDPAFTCEVESAATAQTKGHN